MSDGALDGKRNRAMAFPDAELVSPDLAHDPENENRFRT
jgi:hypothetical protein